MGKKLTKFLNVLTFGHLGRKAGKEASKQEQNKNDQLTLNTIGMPDINAIANALGGVANIVNISATISTITFQVTAMDKIDFELLKKLSSKGVIKSQDNITLIIGDCAMAVKEKLLELKK
ncbi:MAG: hypothetical protein KBS35_00040 [Mycoplasma sp.]|nr:hypothetical protein [Candidatus Hennigella equi]